MMPSSLVWLSFTLVLAVVQLFLTSAACRRQDSVQWATSNRDGEAPRYTGVAARMRRAQANFQETLPIFIGAVLVAHVAGRDGSLVTWGAGLYFLGRLAYIPAYALGLGSIRSLIWGVSMIGLFLVLGGLI
ncbi:MAPEG family protein [Gluconobacter cerinus]|uniref:MAPEG family protein n=1 Tax=Gluconobacter cerinus TaxID=38307 RepID=UPI002010FEA6|nr:MAPEG family protein [Gluconobacter cerinus]